MATKAKTKIKPKVKAGKVSKNPPAPKKLSEIDDIFSSTTLRNKRNNDKEKGTIPPQPTTESKNIPSSSVKVVDATNAGITTSAGSSNPNKTRKQPEDDDFADSRGKNSKYTENGMRVYYMDDLRIGEGEGDTDLCPFDCNCCF
ncbi:hypothetical protein LPJ59_004082 [Coemansia sp. RSA 2399]|nr:hypothetical protein LPJ59_004082 [Coemansia sp. RSA 2399]